MATSGGGGRGEGRGDGGGFPGGCRATGGWSQSAVGPGVEGGECAGVVPVGEGVDVLVTALVLDDVASWDGFFASALEGRWEAENGGTGVFAPAESIPGIVVEFRRGGGVESRGGKEEVMAGSKE